MAVGKSWQTNCPEHVSVILMSGGWGGGVRTRWGVSRAESQPRSSHAVSEKDSEETVVDVGGWGRGE